MPRGAASCDPGSLTLCDLLANRAGDFVLGRNWVSLTPVFTESSSPQPGTARAQRIQGSGC